MQTSVKLKFRPSIVNGKPGSLYFQFIKNRKSRMAVIREYKVYPHEWDSGNESFLINTSDFSRTQYLKELVSTIWEAKHLLIETVRELENHNPACTLAEVAALYYSSKQNPDNSLSTFVAKQRNELMEAGRYRTSLAYQSVLNNILRFTGGKEILLEEITSEYIMEFEVWMRKKGNLANTISFYNRNLRAIWNKAVRCRLITRGTENPFADAYTGIPKTQKRAVSHQVMEQVKELELDAPEDRHLRMAADMFMLSYFLRGISYIDLSFLTKENVKGSILTYVRRKTGQRFEVEVTPEIKTILDRYSTDDKDPLLLSILQGRTDRMAYENALRRQNNGLKQLSIRIGLDKPLTTYVARHSWASIAWGMGISIETVSRGLGHESVKTTLIYLDSFDFSKLHEANRKVIEGIKKVA